MAWTVDTFLSAYPEFAPLAAAPSRGMVSAKLAEASRRVSAAIWGAMEDDGVALLTAHLLSIVPYGIGDTKPVVLADGSTSYMQEFKRLERIVGIAHRVIPHEDEDTD